MHYVQLSAGFLRLAKCSLFYFDIHTLPQDYSALLSRLEDEFNNNASFSLQAFLFHIHPTLHTFSLLYKLVQSLSPSLSTEESDGEDDPDESGESQDEAQKKRREALGLATLPATLRKASSPNPAKPATTSYAEVPIIGGEVLSVISSLKKLQSGDPDAQKVYGMLWRKSSLPYMQILKRWMTRGIWRDRWQEGFIREANWNANVKSSVDEEWERKYTV